MLPAWLASQTLPMFDVGCLQTGPLPVRHSTFVRG